jgi:hypothetical protein
MSDQSTAPLTGPEIDGIPEYGGPRALAGEMLEQGKSLVQVKTDYTTAVVVQKPRKLADFRNRILEEAEFAGTAFVYSWPVKDAKTGKKKTVEGATIKMAMALFRNWGNCAVNVGVNETTSHWIFDACFIDLESGATLNRLYRQRRKLNLGTKMDPDRREDIAFQNVRQKAQQALDTFISRMSGDLEPEEVQKRIETAIGRKIKDWSSVDVVGLRTNWNALTEDYTTFDELFPPIEEKPKAEERPKDKPKEETAPDPKAEPEKSEQGEKAAPESSGQLPLGEETAKAPEPKWSAVQTKLFADLSAQHKIEMDEWHTWANEACGKASVDECDSKDMAKVFGLARKAIEQKEKASK